MILGIDVGGSTTKIVGLGEGNRLAGVLQVEAADQITSMYGAVGHFLRKYSIALTDIDTVVLTGVGASFITEDVFGIPTVCIDEFQAIGYGGLYLAGKEEAFVASLGTGTAFVRATGREIVHIGGSGVGGGTLMGLSSIMLHKGDIRAILALAESGRLRQVDLSVKDIAGREIPSLPDDLTASNFGKIDSEATEADFAAGIINMIFQTVGMLAAFASRNDTLKDFVLIGTLTTVPRAKDIFAQIADMYGIRFIIPPNAVYATAIGAAMSYIESGRD